MSRSFSPSIHPDLLQVLGRPETERLLDAISEKGAFTVPQSEGLIHVLEAVCVSTDWGRSAPLIEQWCGVTEEMAQAIANQLVKALGPLMVSHVPLPDPAEGEGAEEGGLVGWKVPEPLTVNAFVESVVHHLGLWPTDVQEADRLVHLLGSFATDRIDYVRVTERLMRSPKVGGLAYDARVTDTLVEAIDAARVGIIFVEPVLPRAEPKASTAQVPLKASINALPVTASPHDLLSPEDLKELEQVETQLRAHATQEIVPTKPQAETIIRTLIETTDLTFPDDVTRKRFLGALEARLAGIRDAYATRSFLETSAEEGGVGLSGAILAEVSQGIEHAVSDYEQAVFRLEQQKQEQARLVLKQKKLKGEDATKDLTKRYAGVTGQIPDESISPLTSDGARVSLGSSASPVHPEKYASAVAAAKKASQATPIFSQQTIPLSAQGRRPLMQDVRFQRRLSGPVEEIRHMTLTDFRRLAEEPKKAAMRIVDKVGILEGSGYDQKILGIKAWRSSPLNQLYLETTQEALSSGLSIDQVVSARTKKGKETMSETELKAIVWLNSTLRY